MRLILLRKEDLSPAQSDAINARLQLSLKQEGECGPVRAWFAYTLFLYAFITKDQNIPIAIAEASGRPSSGPGWWIDMEYRGQGYGNDLVDALAMQLRAEGVTSILPSIPIQTVGGLYDQQSRRLVVRLRAHFS